MAAACRRRACRRPLLRQRGVPCSGNQPPVLTCIKSNNRAMGQAQTRRASKPCRQSASLAGRGAGSTDTLALRAVVVADPAPL